MIEYKTELEFHKFLNTIAYAMCNSENDYKLFKSIGINANDWPVDSKCASKRALTGLESIINTKGYEYARVKTKSNHDDFKAFELLEEMPDFQDMAIVYKHNIEAWREFFIAQEIVKDKFRHELHKVRSKTKVDGDYFFDVGEYMQQFFVNKEKQIAEKTTQIIFPDFPVLSEVIGGFNGQRISIIAAESGFGKTRLAVNLALSATKIAPVFYFNMEMGKDDFTQLFIQAHTGLSSRQMNKGDYIGRLESLTELNERISSKLYATGGKSIHLETMINKAILYASEHPYSVIIIDYDQKIVSDSRGDEWMLVLKAVERLEDVAKETNSHVIILAQGNEDGEAKSSKRAKQPASVFLSFMKDEQSNFYLKAVKNRWGKKDVEVGIEVDQESGQMRELEIRGDFVATVARRDLFNKKVENHAPTKEFIEKRKTIYQD